MNKEIARKMLALANENGAGDHVACVDLFVNWTSAESKAFMEAKAKEVLKQELGIKAVEHIGVAISASSNGTSVLAHAYVFNEHDLLELLCHAYNMGASEAPQGGGE